VAEESDLEKLKTKYRIKDTKYWTLSDAKKHIKASSVDPKIHPYLYRPFDLRYIYYDDKIIERGDSRLSIMKHMLRPNIAFVCSRQTNPQAPFSEVMVSKWLVDKRALASYVGEARAYPLFLYKDEDLLKTGKAPNFNPAFLKTMSERLGLHQEDHDLMPKGITAENILGYAYAVFFSPTYRSRYAEFLRKDFPRLPLTANLKLFNQLSVKGVELISLHLLESPLLDSLITTWSKSGSNKVEAVKYEEQGGLVWINKTQHFAGIPKEVWQFEFGGYDVCDKWLKDRKGLCLSYDDLQQYQKIVVAIHETMRIMTEIDEAIPKFPIE
jgi:predicted helicase